MIFEDQVKRLTKPDIEINTEKNIFKINDIDLRLFPYWNITFNNGQWFFTIKNKDENTCNNDIEINIPNIKIDDTIADKIGERIVKALKECLETIKE